MPVFLQMPLNGPHVKATCIYLFLGGRQEAYQGHELSNRTLVMFFHEAQFLLKGFPPVWSGQNPAGDQVEPVTYKIEDLFGN